MFMEAKYKILLTELLMYLSISCANNIETTYLTPIKINNRNKKKVEALGSRNFRIMDNLKMKVYSIGDCMIFQTILVGPSGRSSDYHHWMQ